MATTAAELDQSHGGVMRRLHSAPLLGLLALSVPLVWKPAAHAISVTSHSLLHGPALGVACTLFSLLGFGLVWLGFRKDELTATCLGFMGGALIFMFGVEPSFALFATLMDVQAVQHDGMIYLTPNLVVMEASLVIFLVMLIFTGANKDTRCRMFLWFHNNLRLQPNKPTPGYRRQFSRIAAMESVFVSWFFYLVIISLIDPRILGPTHPVTYLVSAGMLIWGIYLVLFKMLGLRSMGGAIRYAIPVTGILWYCLEITSVWGWYTEVWVMPFQYPVANIGFLAAFVLVMFLANWTDARGAAPGE